MKRLLPIFIAIVVIAISFSLSSAQAAITFVASSSVEGSGASTVATTTINTTGGNLLTVSCRHGSTFVNPNNVTDTVGTIFTNFGIASNSNDGALSGYWGIASSTNASNVVRCNFASSVTFREILVMEYSGVATTTPLDTTSTRSTATATTTFSTAQYTTTNANDVIVAFGAGGQGGTLTVNAPFTLRAAGVGGISSGGADNIVSSIQTNASATFSTGALASTWMTLVGAFKAATIPSSSATISQLPNYCIEDNW